MRPHSLEKIFLGKFGKLSANLVNIWVNLDKLGKIWVKFD